MSKETLNSYGLHPERPKAIDSSMLKDYLECRQTFYLRHVLGLRKKYKAKSESAGMDWGTAWHGTQETFWRARISGASIEQAATAGLAWLNSNWPDSVDPTTDKNGRSKERMFKIFLEYVETKVPEIEDDYETLRLEQFFHLTSEEIGLEWSGRIDAVRVKKSNGRLRIWDYKTTSYLTSHYFLEHELGPQIKGYVWAMNQLSTEKCEEAVLDVLYTLKASHQFLRRTFRYTQADLDEWVFNTRLIVNEINFMLDNYLYEPEMWIKNMSNYINRYHRPSEFLSVYELSPIGDTRLRVLQDDYVEDRWDPINTMTEEG